MRKLNDFLEFYNSHNEHDKEIVWRKLCFTEQMRLFEKAVAERDRALADIKSLEKIIHGYEDLCSKF